MPNLILRTSSVFPTIAINVLDYSRVRWDRGVLLEAPREFSISRYKESLAKATLLIVKTV